MSATQKQADLIGFSGRYQETVRCIKTGEILDEFVQDNIIVNAGIQSALFAISQENPTPYVIQTIKLGDDVGTGTIINPQQPTETYTAANQNVIYTIPVNEFIVDYPAINQVRFFATVNGATVMESFPSQPNVVYTSATLRTAGDTVFSFKRFSGRTISALVSIDISWILTLDRT